MIQIKGVWEKDAEENDDKLAVLGKWCAVEHDWIAKSCLRISVWDDVAVPLIWNQALLSLLCVVFLWWQQTGTEGIYFMFKTTHLGLMIFSSIGFYTESCDIWGFHGSENDGDDVLCFDAMQTRRYMPTFCRNILSSSSGLKKETASLSERWHLPMTLHGVKT